MTEWWTVCGPVLQSLSSVLFHLAQGISLSVIIRAHSRIHVTFTVCTRRPDVDVKWYRRPYSDYQKQLTALVDTAGGFILFIASICSKTVHVLTELET